VAEARGQLGNSEDEGMSAVRRMEAATEQGQLNTRLWTLESVI
jgi:hypothetical protein